MPRYLSGLALAFLAVGIVVAGTIVPATMLAGRRPSLRTVVDVWAFFGTLTVIALAVIVGPLILLLRRWLGPRLTVARATAAGAAVGPLMLLAAWFLIRERNETLGQLLSFWWRLPMEFVLGVLPYAAAAALFAGWLAAGPGSRPRRIERAATSS
jgi:hypothetical protein